ncbi:MAG: FAD-binding oxidoreductase [Rhodospirillales bacterium]|nr:FAD-binding oxidoreductase [Rhodospirillales bacterium]MBO6786265.1 FAD-binding oxidoreductase [Rhodospirillales bacterium]
MTDRQSAIDTIKEKLGSQGYVEDPGSLDKYNVEARGLYRGHATFVARPGNTEEVAFVVKTCAELGVPIVPLGGHTGLVGGGIAEDEIIVSTERLNTIHEIDTLNGTMTVGAGCILADIQNAADDAGKLFPLSLAAEGSCRIGGNLSTNAGGTNVLRYGNARDLVLGLEVVLPSGEIWNGLKGLRKDNTGYEMKHLFMGAEGTLGVITAAVLKLYPKPNQTETALIALDAPEAVMKLFGRATDMVGDTLTAFEYMNRNSLWVSCEYTEGVRDPFEGEYPAYVLLELTSPRAGSDLREALEKLLEDAFEAGDVVDAVIAKSGQQRHDIWHIREAISDAQKGEGASIKNDLSIPISKVTEFIAKADAICEDVVPGIRPMTFGHIGDGNLHYNLTQPVGMDGQAFLDKWHDVTDPLNDLVEEMNGSFSAEHGIGRMKRDELVRYSPPVEIDLMRKIKAVIDPGGIMNPGKVL